MSKGEENLIAAVLSDSQDYTSRSSRRVYADWLEEQGDPISQIQANPQMETRRVSEGEATTDSALADASVTIFCFNRKPSHRVRGPRYLRGVGKKHSLVGLPIKSSFECAQKQTRHLLIIRSQTALDNEFKKCEGRPLRRRMG